MTDYLTLFGTAINKQPEQLLGIARRSLKSKVLPRLPMDIDHRYERAIPDDPHVNVEPVRTNTQQIQQCTASRREEYRSRAQAAAEGTLTFLNESLEFSSGDAVSLLPSTLSQQSLHWKLKCWGFEHLQWSWLGYAEPESLPEDHRRVHRLWLQEWLDGHAIADEPEYLRHEWMPHSACLRILNWTRYESVFGDVLAPEFQREIRQFVYKNAAFMADNVEYGVGGNHLIENAAALLLAGVYLDEEQWRRQGTHIFERAASNQFFDDGGHFERSPMYHIIVCQRYLTAHSLLTAIGEESTSISQCGRKCVRFLERLRPPDGRIPLLNDSAFEETLLLKECLAYAGEVDIERSDETDQYKTDGMADSGFYWLGEGNDQLLVAAHEIAVPHIPAHAHAHPGHVCLWVDGVRVLTDTGVCEYRAGPRRRRSRSIRSHNTVQVGETDPVRMASSFWLWGRLDPSGNVYQDGTILEFSYAVSGIGRPTYRYGRTVEYDGSGWTITDQVDAEETPVTSRLHVHPEFDAEIANGRVQVTNAEAKPVLSIAPFGHETVSIKDAPYYPEYGKEISRGVIEIQSLRSERFGSRLIRPKAETTETGS